MWCDAVSPRAVWPAEHEGRGTAHADQLEKQDALRDREPETERQRRQHHAHRQGFVARRNCAMRAPVRDHRAEARMLGEKAMQPRRALGKGKGREDHEGRRRQKRKNDPDDAGAERDPAKHQPSEPEAAARRKLWVLWAVWNHLELGRGVFNQIAPLAESATWRSFSINPNPTERNTDPSHVLDATSCLDREFALRL